MQPQTNVHNCSDDPTQNHQQESSTTAIDGGAERQSRQENSVNTVVQGDEQETEEIGMSLASIIPSQVVAGSVMDTPLVVLLHRDMRSSMANDDIWVFVSLIDANSSTRGRDDVLKGQRADNAHPILGCLGTRDDTFAYASFPNLLISRSGRYKFCVTAIDMRDQSYVLPAITSDAFEVVDPTPSVPQDINTDEMRHLTLANLRAR